MRRGYRQRSYNSWFTDGNNSGGDGEDGDDMEVNWMELVETIYEK